VDNLAKNNPQGLERPAKSLLHNLFRRIVIRRTLSWGNLSPSNEFSQSAQRSWREVLNGGYVLHALAYPRRPRVNTQNCFSVTPALMIPVEEVPAETMLPISSTISDPLHFWCVKVSTPCFRSSRWISCTYAAAPRLA